MKQVWLGEDGLKKYEEIKGNNITVYSFSRLESFENCKYGYYLNYKEKSISDSGNIYSELGSLVHEMLENKSIAMRNNEIYSVNERQELLNKVDELYNSGITFVSDSIKNSFIECMIDFYNKSSFCSLPIIFNELYFLLNIDDNWIQGYIDCVLQNEDGTIDIIDFKTSSKYRGDDIEKHGRQLLIYKMAMETAGYKVKRTAWNMLKYVYVCWQLKNGNIKKKMCQRNKMVDEMSSQIITFCKSNHINIDNKLESAILMNDIEMLPKEVYNHYYLDDCLLEYDSSEFAMVECENYIKNVINRINNEQYWDNKIIDNNSSFFCNNLCGARKVCKYIEEYNRQWNVVDGGIDEFDLLLYGKV